MERKKLMKITKKTYGRATIFNTKRIQKQKTQCIEQQIQQKHHRETQKTEKNTKSWESIAEANLTASKLRKLTENQAQKKTSSGDKKTEITDNLDKKCRNQV